MGFLTAVRRIRTIRRTSHVRIVGCTFYGRTVRRVPGSFTGLSTVGITCTRASLLTRIPRAARSGFCAGFSGVTTAGLGRIPVTVIAASSDIRTGITVGRTTAARLCLRCSRTVTVRPKAVSITRFRFFTTLVTSYGIAGLAGHTL